MHIINGGLEFKFKYLSSFNAQLTVNRFDFETPTAYMIVLQQNQKPKSPVCFSDW